MHVADGGDPALRKPPDFNVPDHVTNPPNNAYVRLTARSKWV